MEKEFFQLRVIISEAGESSREMDMDIFFKISAKSMNDSKDSWDTVFIGSKSFYCVCSEWSDIIEEMSICPEEKPQLVRHSKGNMLPICLR